MPDANFPFAAVASVPRTDIQRVEDIAKILEIIGGIQDRAKAHDTACRLVSVLGSLGTQRAQSLTWADAQLMPTIKELFMHTFELHYAARRGGFFSGKSSAQASKEALDDTRVYMKDLLSSISLSFGAGLQATPAVEAEIMRQVVQLIGQSGFPARPATLSTGNIPGQFPQGGVP